MIEPRKIVGKDDVFEATEVNTVAGGMASQQPLPRGLRAWHVGHSKHVATRETLGSLAGKRVCRTTDKKGRKANGTQGVGWRYSTDEGGKCRWREGRHIGTLAVRKHRTVLSNREDVTIELRRNSGSECASEEPCALIVQARFCEGPGTTAGNWR